jgi:hypothetical protein
MEVSFIIITLPYFLTPNQLIAIYPSLKEDLGYLDNRLRVALIEWRSVELLNGTYINTYESFQTLLQYRFYPALTSSKTPTDGSFTLSYGRRP